MKLHPGGLATDFKRYFDQLLSDDMRLPLTPTDWLDFFLFCQVWKEKEKAVVSIHSSYVNLSLELFSPATEECSKLTFEFER